MSIIINTAINIIIIIIVIIMTITTTIINIIWPGHPRGWRGPSAAPASNASGYDMILYNILHYYIVV